MAQEKQDILVAKLMADVSSFKKGMNEATTKANNSANKLQKTFAKVGNAMKFALAAGVAFLAYDAINTVKDFEQGIANLAAVTGQSIKEVEGLKKEALKLGGATAYTANEVTQLQTELAKLGFRERDIINLTKPILNLAQATGTDLANAAALAGSVVQSFGLEAKDTVSIVDIMTKSFSASALDIRKFEVGIRQVAPVAKQANVQLSEVTAMLGVLANNGVRAETAGVGLRNILLEAAKRGKPFEELLREINESTDKAAVAMELFGKENAAVGVILAESTTKVAELNSELIKSQGTAQEMADKQLDTLTGSITLLTSAWDGFILSLEDGDKAISKFTKTTLRTFTRALQTLTNLSNYMETVNPFKSINEYSKETLDLILDIGRSAQSGEDYAKILAPLNAEVEAMDFSTLKTSLGDIKLQFQTLLDEQGDDVETVTTLWNRYKERIVDAASAARQAAWDSEGLNAEIVDTSTNLEEVTKDLETVAEVTEKARKNLDALGGSFYNLGTAVNNSKAPIGNFNAGMSESMVMQQQQMQIANALSQGFQQAFTEIGYAAVNGLGLAATGLQGFLGVMIQTATQAIGVALSQSLANGVLASTNLAASLGPAGIAALPVLIGGAIAAVKAGFSQVPALANGGIATGPTMALVGEYSGARSNPEVIAPLNKLQNMINGGNASGGNGGFVASTKIQGSDLLLSIERATNQRNRTRGF